MLPVETPDPEYPTTTGSRKDKTNLINEWLKNKQVTSVLAQIMHFYHFYESQQCSSYSSTVFY